MRVFVVHDGEGNVLGMVRAQQDDAPPVLMSGTPGQIVTEVESVDDVESVYSAGDEASAVEAAQEFRVDLGRRIVRR
jgi:hypothetical protein